MVTTGVQNMSIDAKGAQEVETSLGTCLTNSRQYLRSKQLRPPASKLYLCPRSKESQSTYNAQMSIQTGCVCNKIYHEKTVCVGLDLLISVCTFWRVPTSPSFVHCSSARSFVNFSPYFAVVLYKKL